MSRNGRRKRRGRANSDKAADQLAPHSTQRVPTASNEPINQTATGPPCEYALPDEAYFQERTMLIEMEQKGADQHDKAILTLTTGALALSLTFIDRIASNPDPGTLWLIGTAWLSLIASIITILFSFLTSQLACRRQRDLLDDERTHGIRTEATNRWANATLCLNFVAYGLFVAGVAFLAAFSWSNL